MGTIAVYWGEIAGILSALTAAMGALMARSLGRSVHPIAMNAIRCSVAAIGFGLLWLMGTGQVGNWLAALPLLFVSVVGGLIVGDSFYLAAITRIGPGRAAPLAMSFPLPTTVLSVLLVGETVSPLKAAGIVVGVAGIWLIAKRGRGAIAAAAGGQTETARDSYVGSALAIAASLCWAVSIVALKPALALVSTEFANLSRMVFAGVVLTIASRSHLPAMRQALSARSIRLTAVATGVVSVFTTSLMAECVLIAGSSTAALLSSMTPVFAAPLAWLIWREALNARLILGICLGILSITMVTMAGT